MDRSRHLLSLMAVSVLLASCGGSTEESTTAATTPPLAHVSHPFQMNRQRNPTNTRRVPIPAVGESGESIRIFNVSPTTTALQSTDKNLPL